ncbi:MAG: hypothetical protein KAS84_06740 [Anaerolineales bacterium]|nr:hypothetical protein [Anaerolineales bacterium]
MNPGKILSDREIESIHNATLRVLRGWHRYLNMQMLEEEPEEIKLALGVVEVMA